jgi:hypothetical protein
MGKKLLLLLVLGGVAALIMAELPGLKREIKILKM